MICDYCGYERGATVTATCPHCGAPTPTEKDSGWETYLTFNPVTNGYERKMARYRAVMAVADTSADMIAWGRKAMEG